MPTINHNTKPLDVAGVKHRTANFWFTTNAASGEVATFGGAYVNSITRTAVGTYRVSLAGFRPVSLVSCFLRDLTVHSPRLGLVTLAPAGVSMVLYMHNHSANLADFNNVNTRGVCIWKMFSGKDRSGL